MSALACILVHLSVIVKLSPLICEDTVADCFFPKNEGVSLQTKGHNHCGYLTGEFFFVWVGHVDNVLKVLPLKTPTSASHL